MTDEELLKLEREIEREFRKASKDVKKEAERYFKQFAIRYAEQYELYQKGVYTDEQFRQWCLAQWGRGKHLEQMSEKLAERMYQANKVAAAYMNKTNIMIFALNYNFESYISEKVSGNTSFQLINDRTVKFLLDDKNQVPDAYMFKKKKVVKAKDFPWNKKNVKRKVLQATLQGKHPHDIAKQLTKEIPGLNQKHAIMNARTAVTWAQNGGRYKSWCDAEDLYGLEKTKKWMATHDLRTRPSHRKMDGEEQPLREEFSNGLMFPGDENGDPEEFYGCRCTMRTVDALESGTRMLRIRNGEYDIKKANGEDVSGIPKEIDITEETYYEWARRKGLA